MTSINFFHNYTVKNSILQIRGLKHPKFSNPVKILKNRFVKSSASYSIGNFKQQSSLGSALYNSDSSSVSNGEIVPWGASVVWQGENIISRGNFASDCYAFVIDSGVLNTTGDINLASNLDWHRSWISGETPFTDGNGHGTHVSGTIGALVNGKGIVGVAPGAQIVSLKVFDSSGSGTSDTTIIDAINYATSIINNNNLDKNKVVINMSLSGGYSPSLDTVMRNAADQGIRFSVAAGNMGQDADNYSPSSTGDHKNVFSASAVDSSYRMPFWSNWDRLDSNDSVDDVDFAAPGVGIISYYKNGQLTSLSGTSMSTAHLSGLLITGGVQAGGYVTANIANTADPFTITNTQVVKSQLPSTAQNAPQQDSTPPPSTYSFKCDSVVEEGQVFKVNITTTNVKPGLYLYWQISGVGIDIDDFNKKDNSGKIDNLWASPIVANDGTSSVEFLVKKDAKTEGNEVFKFELFDRSGNLRQKVGETFVTIQDTSKTPVPIQYLWGTGNSDVITGSVNRDIICGVTPTGTTSASMGVGQIDVLTGSSDADVFVLGDNRGVFYNDGIKDNIGKSDYALIKDFKVGEDKIQVKRGGGGYLCDVVNGDLYFYMDNSNGKLDTIGSNLDELIAVFQGVSGLSNAEYITVR